MTSNRVGRAREANQEQRELTGFNRPPALMPSLRRVRNCGLSMSSCLHHATAYNMPGSNHYIPYWVCCGPIPPGRLN
jgi:hypothetical protein